MNDHESQVLAALERRAKADATVNAVLQNDLGAALRNIDQRLMTGARDRLRVNQPEHTPSPRTLVPSLTQPKEGV